MAEKMPSTPPQATNAGSNTNAPFTPRSTTFPDAPDSDDEFDVFDPTPLNSPGGPRYDDLPPSYDEAQQQARSGIAALDPVDLEVHRMVLDDQQSPGQLTPQPGHLLSNPHAYEFEPENMRNASGLGMTVPVQHISTSGQVPVGHVSDGPASTVDPISTLLQGALQFTHHEPDADVQYAPRLSQPVAIPQDNQSLRGRTHHHGPGRHRGCGRRGRGRGCGPEVGRIPGQWPTQTSSESLGTSSEEDRQSVQFLRAYAKALHAHSIRPAEFADFLDGLNVLCDATHTTSLDLSHGIPDADSPASTVHNYVRSANEAFFAPRGLKVSLQSLSALVDALKIPDARGQRSGALASALDVSSSPARKAQALHPWIAQLETDMPGLSSQALLLKEMDNRFRLGSEPISRKSTGTRSSGQEKASLERQDSDPPHSVPEADATPGRWGMCEPNWGHRGRQGSHRGGMGPGRHPWGGRGGWGGPGWAGTRGPGSFNGNAGPPDMQAFGQHMGKWGENFGRMMGEWGQQFGKQAEQWGQEMGRRAETFGDQVATTASGSYSYSGQSRQPAAASAGFGGLEGQETGVHRGDSSTSVLTSDALAKNERKEKEKSKLKKKHHKEERMEDHDESDDDDDDDASSISSSSSSSSSESEDEDPDAESLFVQRIREINQASETSRAKGKKSAEEIAREREAAIEKAQSQRTVLQIKNEQRREKRAVKREFRQKKRELRREHMRRKRELKGFGKNKERKQYMKEWREKKKELRAAKRDAKREWRESKWERKRLAKREGYGGEWKQGADDMAWIVVENLRE